MQHLQTSFSCDLQEFIQNLTISQKNFRKTKTDVSEMLHLRKVFGAKVAPKSVPRYH
jgi:hypothetical protein